MQLLQGASDDILTVASSTLCNLLLEFSPSKEPILESGAVDMLCGLTRRKDPALRLNGIWALMVRFVTCCHLKLTQERTLCLAYLF